MDAFLTGIFEYKDCMSRLAVDLFSMFMFFFYFVEHVARIF